MSFTEWAKQTSGTGGGKIHLLSTDLATEQYVTIPTLSSTSSSAPAVLALSNAVYTWVPVADAALVMSGNTYQIVAFTSISTSRQVTLPAASTQAGQRIIIMDFSGSVTSSIIITIVPAGADTIKGAVASVALTIPLPYCGVELVSNGSNGWDILWISDMSDSPNETYTGAISADYKRVIAKNVSCGALPNSTTKNTAHGLANGVLFERIGGYAYYTSGPSWLPSPRACYDNGDVDTTCNATNIAIKTYSDQSAITVSWVKLLYTKTS